jgi:hypothetical protein
MADGKIMRTPVVRLSFPNLATTHTYEDKAKGIKGLPRYSADFIFEPTDKTKFQVLEGGKTWATATLTDVLKVVANEMWPGIDVAKAIEERTLQWPVRSGDLIAQEREAKGKKHADVTKGKLVISAASQEQYAPQLYFMHDGKAVELNRDSVQDMARIKKVFRAGNYVVGGFKVAANQTKLGRFLNLYLNSVIYMRPGEPIGGIDADTMTAGIEGGESILDPTVGVSEGTRVPSNVL